MSTYIAKQESKEVTRCVSILQQLFTQYVTPKYPELKFIPYCVKDESDTDRGDENSSRFVYDDRKVQIRWVSHLTWRQGDYDRFTDYSVYVNGKELINHRGD